MLFFFLSVTAFVLCGSVHSQVTEDEIEWLPGWEGRLPSRQFSGYLPSDVAATHFLHYWLVESESDPSNDPLVLWLNGGPGCSSLEGYFAELGPFHFKTDTEKPSLYYNPSSWSKIANVVFLESPVGVGFSFSTNGQADYVSDDALTAEENFLFLINFFDQYPGYKNRSFYITGESYAGIYIPTLVDLIRRNKNGTSKLMNLKGFMIGNGCIGNTVGACGPNGYNLTIHANFIHQHGLVSDATFYSAVGECGVTFGATSLPECQEKLTSMFAQAGRTNIYNIYAECLPSNNTSQPLTWRVPLAQGNGSWHLTYCGDPPTMPEYFNDPTVRKAIHVRDESAIGPWVQCSKTLVYTQSVQSLLQLYPTLIREYRTLIYSGDVDGCVPYIGTEEWTSELEIPKKEEWRPWTVNDQVAGYVTTYVLNDFKFATVKGAGHMVPQYKPVQAFYMFKKFINNEEF